MSWEEFRLALNYSAIGFVVGYFWHPGWTLIKKIIHEAKVAKHEWRNPKK
jgi:hypothetical protein